MSYDWPYSEKDAFLEKVENQPVITLEEIFNEEDMLMNIRLKSDEYGNL